MPEVSHPHMDLVMEVPEDAVDAHLAQGWVLVAGIDPKPAQSDTKDVWVEFAASAGMDAEEASAHTKQDLIDLYS